MPMHIPSRWIFLLSLALIVLAIISVFLRVPHISIHAVWVAALGWLVLAIGCLFKTA